VFVHALQTVRRLPRTGSSRPPSQARLRLYGLYKQSMEGDVLSILARPTLPPRPPELDPTPSPPNYTVHRYAAHDVRAREAQAEIDKWDAWHACAGMSRTEAKRGYISTLIETMKMYASGTQESRELVGELEFVWSQIRSQSGSSEESGEGMGDSPTRRLPRAGIPPSGEDDADGGRNPQSDSALMVLSPVSRGGSGDVVEGEDAHQPARDEEADANADADAESEDDDFRDASESHLQTPSRQSSKGADPLRWRRRIESALSKMTVEIAALREHMEMSESRTGRRKTGVLAWLRWLVWAGMWQAAINAILILLFVLWGRWRGDRRAEEWVKRRWKGLQGLLSGSWRLPYPLRLF
jgi:acyl-CoA-binding protein